MIESRSEMLSLAPDGSWLRNKRHWQPREPFYAVIGDSELSATLTTTYRAGLGDRALAATILPAQVESGQLGRLKRSRAACQLAGIHVVGALQEEVFSLCDSRTDTARETGIANVVRIQDELWIGHDIESGSIQAVLTQAWPGEVAPVQGEVLGAGGSARAAVWALVQWGVHSLTIRDHSSSGQQRVQSWLSRTEWKQRGFELRVTSLPKVPEQQAEPRPTVWIACLPGDMDVLPFLPVTKGQGNGMLLDLRFSPTQEGLGTPAGIRWVGLEPVLLMQCGLSFAWWFGLPVPWQVMRKALIR